MAFKDHSFRILHQLDVIFVSSVDSLHPLTKLERLESLRLKDGIDKLFNPGNDFHSHYFLLWLFICLF